MGAIDDLTPEYIEQIKREQETLPPISTILDRESDEVRGCEVFWYTCQQCDAAQFLMRASDAAPRYCPMCGKELR